MKLKQRPEDFVVREAYRVDWDPRGPWWVYLMDKQKLTTFEAVERIAKHFRIPMRSITFCGLKDKQGRTEQIVAIRAKEELSLQEPDLRLKFLGRTRAPLSADNLTANRFSITVRDLSEEEVGRLPLSVSEVRRVGVINYFDSQRFGALKHGQGFIAKDLIRGDVQRALYNYMARPSPLDTTEDAKVKRFWAEHWGDWTKRCPYKGTAKYRHILQHLQENPKDWAGAFMHIEQRYRTLLLYEYQSYLWNEGVRRLLLDVLPEEEMISLRYQAGRLLFPRVLSREQFEDLKARTFPLLGPDSTFDDARTARAVFETLERERIRLDDLALPHMPGLFFKHEERPVVVIPGKLVVGKPRPDELNRGRLKVNVAFTLPPGAYATLVTRRLFWFSELEQEAKERGEMHPAAQAMLTRAFGGPTSEVADLVETDEEEPPRPRRPKMGFLERQRRKKEERAARRQAAAEAKTKVKKKTSRRRAD
ncbi:MAG TPA: tRNA pseudouridine(13) synthase TruD [Fredinandcohnia sp.]|nr:tRNA pseudouridine(13) synthase TruD [Fredinandcohnia sp.]